MGADEFSKFIDGYGTYERFLLKTKCLNVTGKEFFQKWGTGRVRKVREIVRKIYHFSGIVENPDF